MLGRKYVELDHILVGGDKLYKPLKCRDKFDQLLCQVKIFQRTVNWEILEKDFHDSIAVYGDSFSVAVFENANVIPAQAAYCFYVVAICGCII